MTNFMLKHKLDQVNEGATGGPPPADFPKPPVQPPPTENTPPVEEEGDTDELGYKKVAPAPGAETPPATAKQKAASKEPEKVENPASGYTGEPPKVEEEPPPATPPADPPAVDELDPIVKDLPAEEQKKIKEFAKTNGVTKEVAAKFVEMRKQEIKEFNEAIENTRKTFERDKLKTRAAWHKELRDDPTFGGANFEKSVTKAETVLDQFMPNLKKSLTESKVVLPPYIMRDLANLHGILFQTEKFNQGEPKTVEEAPAEDDGTAFYKQ